MTTPQRNPSERSSQEGVLFEEWQDDDLVTIRKPSNAIRNGLESPSDSKSSIGQPMSGPLPLTIASESRKSVAAVYRSGENGASFSEDPPVRIVKRLEVNGSVTGWDVEFVDDRQPLRPTIALTIRRESIYWPKGWPMTGLSKPEARCLKY